MGTDTYLCGHSLGSSWWSMGSRNLPDGASQQGIRQVEPTPDLCMDPESKKNSVACKDCLVFISLELEYMDTDKRAKKQDCELERQSCSPCARLLKKYSDISTRGPCARNARMKRCSSSSFENNRIVF